MTTKLNSTHPFLIPNTSYLKKILYRGPNDIQKLFQVRKVGKIQEVSDMGCLKIF